MDDDRHALDGSSLQQRAHVHHVSPFGEDWFGRKAEAFARLFGTPGFLLAQTALVVVWIGVNVAAAGLHWDPYPFILLNLAFSLQAAYAAPLILLAQTRQADRDKVLALADAEHREAVARRAERWERRDAIQWGQVHALLESNRKLIEEVRRLSGEVETMTRDRRDPLT